MSETSDSLDSFGAHLMARTVWGEARGEGEAGMRAVAHVIHNRARHPRWWGTTVAEVCLQDRQFSCWNAGDPNRVAILRLPATDPHLVIGMRLAGEVLTGQSADPTNGADHYHAASVTPHWIEGRGPVARIGNHLFYRLEIPPPPAVEA